MIRSTPFVAVKKLVGQNIVQVAAKHNLRELQGEVGTDGHIDANRMGLNQVLAGAATAAEVAAHAEGLMHTAGVTRLRRDAVRGIELVVSLPPFSSIAPPVFFTEALSWATRFFGVPVLSAVIHLDEAAPHCHVLLLPLVGGRMAGSDLVGNRQRLQAMQSDFFEQVGAKHGLVRQTAPKRLSTARRREGAARVLNAILARPEALSRAEVKAALLDVIASDPEALLAVLELKAPVAAKSRKSFVEIMTKPCKPEKPIGFKSAPKPIGFAPDVPASAGTLSCVGFGAKSPPLDEPEAVHDEVFTRSRDDEPSANWDSDRGEFVKPLKPQQSTVREEAISELRRSFARMEMGRSGERLQQAGSCGLNKPPSWSA